MPHRTNVAEDIRSADIVECSMASRDRHPGNERLCSRKDLLAVSLSERDEPHGGRHEICGEGLEVGLGGEADWNAMARAGDGDDDG